MTTGRPPQGLERGAILAFALLLLAMTSATAAFAPRLAALELARSSATDALSRADAAAASGLDLALHSVDILSTAPTTLLTRSIGEASVRVDARFLGFRTPAGGDGGLVEWHFALTAVGASDRGARSVHRRHVYILAPAPPDPTECHETGCTVPPLCQAGSGCENDLRMPPAPVGWHLPEEPA